MKDIFKKITIEDRLVETSFRPSGFDYMRIVLALAVILAHTKLICFGKDVELGIIANTLERASMFIVPMFFALSGFLVAGSLERSKTLVSFLGLRIFRIMPALTVEVVLSALILGSFFTTLTLGEYYTHPEFLAYFWNIVGEIHYTLPGVFESNPFNQVNGQLWTVPYELVCYVLLSLFAVVGIFKNKLWLLYTFIFYYFLQIGNSIMRAHTEVVGPAGSTVVMCFVAGLFIYKYRQEIPWSKGLFYLMLALSVALVCIPNGIRFAALPMGYITIYLGLLNPIRNKLVLSGDYSYGVYLYGFPIQQALVAVSPLFLVWYWNFIAASILSVLMACFSWWIIEKPVLDKRDILKKIESRYLEIPIVKKLKKII